MKIYPTKFRVAVFILAVGVVTLAGISCSAFRNWREAVRETNEQTLRTDLVIMREAIRTYAIKRGELPQTLKDLDAEGVYSTVPDPITDRADWQVTIGEDPALVRGKRGVINVHSASTAISSEGTPYNTW
jgi:general secretion pathway protein G